MEEAARICRLCFVKAEGGADHEEQATAADVAAMQQVVRQAAEARILRTVRVQRLMLDIVDAEQAAARGGEGLRRP